MANFSITQDPLTLSEFVSIATCAGWTIDPTAPREQASDIVLTHGDRQIVAFVEPTAKAKHVGFHGDACGLVETWQEGDPGYRFLVHGNADDD